MAQIYRVFFVNNNYQVENVPSLDDFPSLPIDPDFPSSSLLSGTEPVDELRIAVADFTVHISTHNSPTAKRQEVL